MNGEMDNPPSTLVFEMHRRATGGTSTLTANLEEGSDPVRYEAQWNVRLEKGRWEIKTQGYVSNTLQFKIDKREQVVEVAKSWEGVVQGSALGAYCDDFVRYVYGYVGLAVAGGGNAVDDLYNSTDTTAQDPEQGSITFYHFPGDANTTWRHAGVNIGGGQIVDQNCGLPHSVYPTYIDRYGYLQTDNDHPPTIGQHSETDEALVNPTKYADPSHHTTAELRQLDNE